MDTWFVLGPFAVFYHHLVKFVEIWYIMSRFGILYQGKSGNPASEAGSQKNEVEAQVAPKSGCSVIETFLTP
jgi:hypothetical protein